MIYDVTIIGGGPVGLFGATMAGLHGLKAQIIESLPELGGQLYALYPEKMVYDVAGFPAVPAKELAGQLISQAMRYHPAVNLDQAVQSIERTDDNTFILNTGVAQYETRAILITVGIGAFTPRKLPAARAEEFEQNGVYYLVPNLGEFSRKTVAVIGGGDTALDWTLALSSYAKQVFLIHRRHEFRAQESSLDEVREKSNVTLKTLCEVTEIHGEKHVEALTILHSDSEETEVLAVDSVISGLGFQPNLGPVKTWGIDLKGNSIKVSLDSMQTSIPGIYAAGDVASYPGKVKLIATGFGEIGIAIAQIRTFLDPSKKGLPHSTNIKTAKDPVG